MTKKAILKHKIIRAYHNPENWEYSKAKGYKGYFGFDSLESLIKYELKSYRDFYGPTLRTWRYN